MDRMRVRYPWIGAVVVAAGAVGVAGLVATGLVVVMLIGGCLGMDAMGGWYRLRCMSARIMACPPGIVAQRYNDVLVSEITLGVGKYQRCCTGDGGR